MKECISIFARQSFASWASERSASCTLHSDKKKLSAAYIKSKTDYSKSYVFHLFFRQTEKIRNKWCKYNNTIN